MVIGNVRITIGCEEPFNTKNMIRVSIGEGKYKEIGFSSVEEFDQCFLEAMSIGKDVDQGFCDNKYCYELELILNGHKVGDTNIYSTFKGAIEIWQEWREEVIDELG